MSILPNRKSPQLSVERVNQLRDELEAYIDERAAQLKLSSPGIPLQVCRNLLVARSGGCSCLAYIHIQEQNDADAELKAQQRAGK
jgi:hypothetical protein